MPTVSLWRNDSFRRAARVVAGYNLPFVIWTAGALVLAARSHVGVVSCPVRSVLGWCPSCGLTRSYAAFLSGDGITGWWFGLILAGFVANLLWSLWKARRVWRDRLRPMESKA
jgi:hypothetical protein